MTLRPFLARPLALTLAGLLLTGAASAQSCVTADQLSSGLLVDYESGGQVEVRLLENGLVELREVGSAEGGGDLRFLSRFGVYDIEASLAADGDNAVDHRVIYDYGGEPLPEPAAGGTAWIGPVTANFPDGERDAQTAAYVFGANGTLDIDGCSYDTLTVDATFVRADGWEGQSYLFFRDLGFAMLVGRSGPDQDKAGYQITSIRPVEG
ncbi:MAG TPA: hypothetical protein PK450_06615 [Paracoccaceae bacterium]|nr:hypothetical protein [Paracoccaceae bacterium]